MVRWLSASVPPGKLGRRARFWLDLLIVRFGSVIICKRFSSIFGGVRRGEELVLERARGLPPFARKKRWMEHPAEMIKH
jgi:hypothetical protein